MSWKRKLLLTLGIVLLSVPVIILGLLSWYLWAGKEVFAGYSAKVMASGIFVAGRTPESIAAQELAVLPFLRYTVDRDAQSVTTWIFPRHRRTAVYREGLGAALSHGNDVEALRSQARPELFSYIPDEKKEPWPRGDEPSGNPKPSDIDEVWLKEVVNGLFSVPKGILKRHARAVVVVYRDEIVAERYAEGFDADQRFLGWSMTKSIFHALYGIAVRQGMLSIGDIVPMWQDAPDSRSQVTIDMLLRMSSGLDYNEFDFIPPADLTTMLFLRPGAGVHAASLSLRYPPDTLWAYASASTNILSLVLRQTYGDDAYYALPYRELFARIGMHSAIIEADASGAFVGSSFMYATARDYARFGLLYLHDGVWQGERILPEGWVDYGRTPTPTAPHGNYGAHWWLVAESNTDGKGDDEGTSPAKIFFASGFEGQFIVVIPARQIVIVYLSLDLLCHDPMPMVRDILGAFPE